MSVYLLGLARDRINNALGVARRYGDIDGSHHKAWVIDQMVRALTGCSGDPNAGFQDNDPYRRWVEEHCDGEDGPATFSWDEGIAP